MESLPRTHKDLGVIPQHCKCNTVEQASNPSIQEVEAGRSEVQRQPSLHKTLSQEGEGEREKGRQRKKREEGEREREEEGGGRERGKEERDGEGEKYTCQKTTSAVESLEFY